MTIDEISSYLKLSKETIYKMAQQNKIPAIKIGNQWKFNQALINQWLQQQANELSLTILSKSTEQEINNG